MLRIIRIIVFCLVPVSVSAQLVPVTDQYMLNPMTINPAFAGGRGALNIATFYRIQWIGLQGAPETLTYSMDAPFVNNRLGLGLMLINDRIGVKRENQFNTAYAYRIKLKKGLLAFGLGAGVILTRSTNSDLVVIDPGDEQFLANSPLFVVPNFSFGIQYSSKKYFAGFSIPKLLSYTFDFTRNKYVLNNDLGNYSYMLNTGYVFDLTSNVRFYPSTLLMYSKTYKFQYDLNAHFCFFDRVWAGASYRSGRTVSALLQVQPFNQIRIGYTFDFDINKLARYENGTHEIMLRYEFRYKVNAVNPLIF